MTTGVDLYRYQTVTDYRALAGAVGFAWIKLTDGNAPAVVRGDKQVHGCREAHILTGGYHFAQPGNPITQADVFLSELTRLSALDIAPALDLEDPFTAADPVTRAFGIRFCQEIAAAGHRPAIYMPASWTGVLRPETWDIPNLVIWLAAYGLNDGKRYSSALTRYYTGRVDVHQYTSVGQLPGISGRVDINHAFTDIRNSARKAESMDILARTTTNPQVWYGNGVLRRKILTPEDLKGIQSWITRRGGNSTVETIDALDAVLGMDVGELAVDIDLPPATVELDYDRFVGDVVDRLAERLGNLTGTLTGMMGFQAVSDATSRSEPTP